MMTRIPASAARERFAEVVNDVAFREERVVLHRHGKDVAAIVSMSDLRLLEGIENERDLKAARKALRERQPRLEWSSVKQKLDTASRPRRRAKAS